MDVQPAREPLAASICDIRRFLDDVDVRWFFFGLNFELEIVTPVTPSLENFDTNFVFLRPFVASYEPVWVAQTNGRTEQTDCNAACCDGYVIKLGWPVAARFMNGVYIKVVQKKTAQSIILQPYLTETCSFCRKPHDSVTYGCKITGL